MADMIFTDTKSALAGKAGSGGPLDFDTDTFKAMLVTVTYVPAAAHAFRSSVTNEVVGTGYTAGGVALTSPTITVSGTAYNIDFADPSWATSTITARAMVVYKNVGTAATDPLVGYWDFGADKTSTGGTFQVVLNASGLLSIA